MLVNYAWNVLSEIPKPKCDDEILTEILTFIS